jgi:hypothetical protein
MLAILALYFLISGPLCVAGYFYGMRQGVRLDSILSKRKRGKLTDRFLLGLQPIEPPVRTNSIPRQVPPAPVVSCSLDAYRVVA